MWSLFEKGKFLEPLVFSNGKSQADVVKEVLNAIESGQKVVFIRGICGTGKSAIALNIARKLGKSSVVVPIKNLQNQYKKDYEGDKYVEKDNKEKLKLSVITGRKNHVCKFLEDNKNATPVFKKEVDSKLNDIFDNRRKEIKETIGKDISADNPNIPCKIEIKERNWNKIKQYLKENPKINIKNYKDIKDVKRVPVASVCPYWCPIVPDEYELKNYSDSKKRTYTGLNQTKFAIYVGAKGCKFYEQFNSFIDSDVIVFNSLKYKLESSMGRKPVTEVEIIDECDEFLDSFSNQKNLNIDRLQNSLPYILGDERVEKMVKELNFPINIISCPTIREKDGLAMSSRNALLSHEERKSASIIYQTLNQAKNLLTSLSIPEVEKWAENNLLTNPLLKFEYFKVMNAENLHHINDLKNVKNVVICTAVKIGNVRLIDNMIIK